MAVTINGTTGITTTGDYDAEDGDKILLGTSDDLQIYHDGSNSYLEAISTGAGDLIVQGTGKKVKLRPKSGEDGVVVIDDGAVELYHNNVKTFETTQFGVGVIAPEGGAAELHIWGDEGDDNNDKFMMNTWEGRFRVQNYTSGSWETNIECNGNGNVELYYNDTKRFATIDDGARVFGRLGIGNDTSGWAENLNVSTDQANGYGIAIRHDHDNAGSLMRFATSDGLCGSVNGSGTSTSYSTSSDYRLKENEVSLSNGITRIKQLKPYRFNFKCNASKTVDGFFAHEVTPVVPEAITGTKDEVETTYYQEGDTIPEGKAVGDVKSTTSPVYQGIDQSKLVPLLTAALQEAITKIETLETKVAALEAA